MAAAAKAAVFNALYVEKRRKQNQHGLFLSGSSFHGPHLKTGALSIKPLLQENHGARLLSWDFPVCKVAVDGSANAAIVDNPKVHPKDEETPLEIPRSAKETTLSAVMADVVNLVKLVDSKDIVELELKHQDYELVIRKSEAVLTPASPAGQFVSQAPFPTCISPPPPMAAPTPAPALEPSPAPTAASPSAPPPLSNLPSILSPMAGTFYKCPAPGEPPFVKVGDKVTKGQVICIVEAMKLMNEIEADQTGTIVEILAEDGKPVAVESPLYAIKP